MSVGERSRAPRAARRFRAGANWRHRLEREVANICSAAAKFRENLHEHDVASLAFQQSVPYVGVLERHFGAELVSVVVFGSQSRRERRSRRLAGDGRPRRDRAR